MEADLPYLIGRVEEIVDVPVEADDLSGLTSDLSILFLRYLRLLASHARLPIPDVELPSDPETLAFCVASVAMLSPLDKQHLLEMTDTRARLQDVTAADHDATPACHVAERLLPGGATGLRRGGRPVAPPESPEAS